MPVLIKVRKNNNQKMPSCYGKYYGKTVATTTMTYRELVKHMAEHTYHFMGVPVLSLTFLLNNV